MYFFIPLSHKKIMEHLQNALDRLGMARHILIEETPPQLKISFSKLGHSHVTFLRESSKKGTTYHVIEEKVSLLHVPLRLILQNELKKVVERYKGFIEEKSEPPTGAKN